MELPQGLVGLEDVCHYCMASWRLARNRGEQRRDWVELGAGFNHPEVQLTMRSLCPSPARDTVYLFEEVEADRNKVMIA